MRGRGAVAAIDVGATKVAVVVASPGDNGEARVQGVGVAPASGLSRGVIDNIQSARDAIAIAVDKAEQSCGMRILSAVVGVSGMHLQSQNNRGIIAIPDRTRPISQDDKARAIEAAGQISIPTNRQIIHVLPRAYWVEGSEPVSDPIGMFGGRLDAETHIVTGSVSAMQNLTRCVEGAGVTVDEFILDGVAAATSVLDEQERLQGVAVVDIGGSLTSLAVYEDGTITHSACLPIAGSHLTQDLARVLRCPWDAAEEVKCRFGAAHPDAATLESVEIQTFGTQGHKQVPVSYICQILQARSEEILELVGLELKRAGYFDRIAAGIVLTGGSSQLRGLPELAETRLEIPARAGIPHGYNGMADLIGSAAYATSIGLVEYALAGKERWGEAPGISFELPAAGFLRRIASWGRTLMPQ